MDKIKNNSKKQILTVDVQGRDTIHITAQRGGKIVGKREFPYEGAVDSRLLTVVDNMFNEHILDKFVSIHVKPGPGIDKTSLLYRIVITLDAALQRV